MKEVKIKIDRSSLDLAEVKVLRFAEAIKEAKTLADELASMEVSLGISLNESERKMKIQPRGVIAD